MIVIILAAGKGTRMRSSLPKVLHSVAGETMLSYSLNLAENLNPAETIVVVGKDSKEVMDTFVSRKINFCIQDSQKGTADAVMAAESILSNLPYDEQVLILYGDMPNIKLETIIKFLDFSKGKDGSVITVNACDPKGYGRVVKNSDGRIVRIVEDRDADPAVKLVKEINTGVYCCKAGLLLERLRKVDNNNSQKEYYLTDIVDDSFTAWCAEDEKEFAGINDQIQLAAVASEIWRARAESLMLDGVRIIDPGSVYIDGNVSVGNDTTIYPNVYLQGETSIGSNCVLHSGVRIISSIIDSGCIIKENCIIEDSFIGRGCNVGPMANLRTGTVLKGDNRIGNFVETKKAVLGEGSKSAHLTYLGDCDIGKNVNISCGVITCNYDGFNKHKTEIGDNAFIGSDVQLIAPVTVGNDVVIGAGSTITNNIEDGALAVARSKQINMAGKAAVYKRMKKSKQ